MQTRICNKCGIEKEFQFFKKEKYCRHGIGFVCKDCRNLENRQIPLPRDGLQYCRTCNTFKELQEFEKCKNCKSGYRNRCKKCRNEIYKQKKLGTYVKPIKLSRKEKAAITKKKRQEFIGKDGSRFGEGRRSLKAKEWSESILKRDDYRCQNCGSREFLETHHIIPWKVSIEKRFDLDNGITYCQSCHRKLETSTSKGWRKQIPKERTCRTCGVLKKIEEYYRHYNGHRYDCKKCMIRKNNERRRRSRS